MVIDVVFWGCTPQINIQASLSKLIEYEKNEVMLWGICKKLPVLVK
jgi:hypothetical protein